MGEVGTVAAVAWMWVALALVLLVAVGVWLSWTASRLDRIHHRIDLARSSLDAQLLHRSGTALELATSGALDPARSLLLLDSAHHARAASVSDFEVAESELSELLRAVLADASELAVLKGQPGTGPLLEELGRDCRKVELARRFHNDVVASARVLRSRRRVRWLRLAGRAAEPLTVDLDDGPPVALLGR